MAFRHGIHIQESPTPLTPPVQVDSALPVVIGVAPIHRLADPAAALNVPIIVYSYSEGVEMVGYSDNWSAFTLSEVLYSQFKVHNIAPLILINVWDPLLTAEDVAAVELPLINGVAAIEDGMAMISTVEVSGPDGAIYERDSDYTLDYEGEKLVITTLPGISGSVNVTYKRADVSKVTASDIVGGDRTGIDLVDEVFLRFQKNAGFLLAPGWSDIPGVAAALIAKAKSLNGGNFSCLALLDFPADVGHSRYADIPAWKIQNSYSSPYAFADWPCVGLGDRIFHASTRMAGLYGEIDAANGGYPYVSASNKVLSMTKVCLVDGKELPLLDQGQANYLNENGIGTFLNWGGWRAWGNETTAYPTNTDVKDSERSVRRMFCWIQNTVNRTIWSSLDAPINKALIDSVLLTLNQWFNTLRSEGAVNGGRVEFLSTDNDQGGMQGGRAFFRIYICPPGAAKDITFDFQYDPDYLGELFA